MLLTLSSLTLEFSTGTCPTRQKEGKTQLFVLARAAPSIWLDKHISSEKAKRKRKSHVLKKSDEAKKNELISLTHTAIVLHSKFCEDAQMTN